MLCARSHHWQMRVVLCRTNRRLCLLSRLWEPCGVRRHTIRQLWVFIRTWERVESAATAADISESSIIQERPGSPIGRLCGEAGQASTCADTFRRWFGPPSLLPEPQGLQVLSKGVTCQVLCKQVCQICSAHDFAQREGTPRANSIAPKVGQSPGVAHGQCRSSGKCRLHLRCLHAFFKLHVKE